ncbi:GIY-YIG nuclease family protein [Polycyclovorans algicola]|uniref:GIY-YIG nuclease family protein n=1 Tax=Polycyclovorans algicola TaxID=616992 RepID=UPI000A0534B4
MPDRPWFVYLLLCRSGRVYTGVTPDLAKRMKAHNTGRGAMFTRLNQPEELLAAKPFPSKGAALSMEIQVKKLSKSQKLFLASSWADQNTVHQSPEILAALQ